MKNRQRRKPVSAPSGPKRRLRDDQSREAILDAAADLFFANGYDTVSVDAIVARVGGSKTTIYRHFAGKDGLLASLVERESARLLQPIEGLDLSGVSMERGLHRLGSLFLDIIYNKRALALHRLVIAQGMRFPSLAARFHRSGPDASAKLFSEFFARCQREGAIDGSRDPSILARQYLDLLKVGGHARLLLGLPELQGGIGRSKIVREAVTTFLHGAVARGKA